MVASSLLFLVRETDRVVFEATDTPSNDEADSD